MRRSMLLKRFVRAWHSLPLHVVLLALLAACTGLPAQVPPQLQHTPGPALVVQERTLQTSAYRVDPPAGWRIVKNSVATEPIVVVLAAPDDAMTITIGEEPLPALPDDPDFMVLDAMVSLPNGQLVYLAGQSKSENASQFGAIFEAVQSSVRLSESMD